MFNHERVREVLRVYARQSQDPTTQTAAVIIAADGTWLTAGMNRLTKGMKYDAQKVSGAEKYEYLHHAEELAIATAARRGLALQDATIALNWFPCAPCARMIVEAGIRTVLCDYFQYEERRDDPRYGFKAAFNILNYAGVAVAWL
jgi:deoxycytidylate deaminase